MKRNSSRPGARLGRAFLWAWAGLAALVCLYAYAVFRREAASPRCLPWAALFLAVWTGLAALLRRGGPRAAKRLFWPVLLCGAAAMAAVSVWFCRAYRYEPLWDPAAVYYGAQGWARGDLTGLSTPTFDADTYFLFFPHNLGATWLLSLWFRLTSPADPWLAACALNGLTVVAGTMGGALAAREAGGPAAGLCALAVLLGTPPLWLAAPAFYTDFLSFAYPALGLFCALRWERARGRGRRAGWLAGAAALWAVGGLVKATVLIVPVAFVLWALLRGRWKRAAAVAAAAGIAFAGLSAGLDRAVYPSQLDRAAVAREETPILHWVMMSLRGDGFYNGTDYAFTRSFADPAERREALREAVADRLRELGPGGLARHILRKTAYTLSDGTLMLSDYYDDYPQAEAWLQDLLLPGGERYALWHAVCGGAHLAMLVLAAWGAVASARRKERRAGECAFLAVFGLMLFLSFWETSRRYWIDFLPLLALCAGLGLDAALPFGRGVNSPSFPKGNPGSPSG